MPSSWMQLIITIIIIIVIPFKGAIRDFYNLLTALRTVSNTYAQVARVRATNRALITCKCHVTYVPLGTKGQLSYSVGQS